MKKGNKNIYFAIGGGCVLFLCLFLVSCISFSNKVDLSNTREEAENIISVNVIECKPIDFIDKLALSGSIQGEKEVNLSFEAEGIIQKYRVEVGDFVRKGQALVELVSDDAQLQYQYAESKYSEASLNAELEEKKFNDVSALFEIGGMAKNRLEMQQIEYLKAKEQEHAAKIDMDYRKRLLERVIIVAPFDGVFLKKYIDAGECVNSNTLIGKFSSVDTVYLNVGIIERDLNKVKIGQEVCFSVDSYLEHVFKGKVLKIAPVISGKSRTMSITITVSNENHLLFPGMFAHGELAVFAEKDVLVVPNECIRREEQNSFVYIVENEKAIRKEIKIGYANNSLSQVNKGLRAGELVVIEELSSVEDGDILVKIQEVRQLRS